MYAHELLNILPTLVEVGLRTQVLFVICLLDRQADEVGDGRALQRRTPQLADDAHECGKILLQSRFDGDLAFAVHNALC